MDFRKVTPLPPGASNSDSGTKKTYRTKGGGSNTVKHPYLSTPPITTVNTPGGQASCMALSEVNRVAITRTLLEELQEAGIDPEPPAFSTEGLDVIADELNFLAKLFIPLAAGLPAGVGLWYFAAVPGFSVAVTLVLLWLVPVVVLLFRVPSDR
tara:strand:+ start:37430 stop:37891 length:462 start_codon:yes stop_codon:yes gene_type:complete